MFFDNRAAVYKVQNSLFTYTRFKILYLQSVTWYRYNKVFVMIFVVYIYVDSFRMSD